MVERIYFDTCVFVDLIVQKGKRFDACEALVKKAINKEVIIVTSSLSIAETNKLPGSTDLPEEQSKKILDYFFHDFIAVRPVDRPTAEYAHKLTRTNGLMPNDAIHVATAILNKATVLYTYDGHKIIKKRRKGLLNHNLLIGSPPLRIEVPPDPDKGSLFAEENKVSDDDATAT